MRVIRKDAAVTAPVDDDFPGTFEAILSAPTKDRDGDTLLPEEWKQPLPDHITVDVDHEMSVAGTIGSAKPWIDEKGNLRISGRFASTPKAQEVRTLMQEGHINRTSVAFMSERTQKDGVSSVTREVLNAAVVAIPSNREAVVLSAKGLVAKSGARNSKADQVHLDAIARHAIALGANIETGDDLSGGDDSADVDVAAAKGLRRAQIKSIAGSLEAVQDRVRDALQDANPNAYVYLRGTVPDGQGGGYAVFGVEPNDGPWTDDLFQQSYTDSGFVVTLVGDPKPVDLTEVVTSDPDEDADSGAAPDSAAGTPKGVPAAETRSAPVEDHVDLEAAAARLRLYSTLSER